VPLSLEDAERLVAQYVTVYNEQRLHSALGYVAPLDRLLGRQAEIHAARDYKLEQARAQRERAVRSQRKTAAEASREQVAQPILTLSGETEAGSAGTQPC
jgi:putative transposase